MKRITKAWLTKQHACPEGIAWFQAQKATAPVPVLRALMTEKRLDWANWLIVRCMTYKQYVAYAIFAAEQVLELYERQYPDDKRPRHAIEAAKACLKNLSKENKAAAGDAAMAAAGAAARAAAEAARAAAEAARAAAEAARAAAWAAAEAARAAAWAAAEAAGAAAWAAARAAAWDAMQQTILDYGMGLL